MSVIRIKLSTKEYRRRLDLFEQLRGTIIPSEEERLYNYIIKTGDLPRITKTGRLLILIDNQQELEYNETNM